MLKTLTLLDMLRMQRVCSFLFFLFVELVGFFGWEILWLGDRQEWDGMGLGGRNKLIRENL